MRTSERNPSHLTSNKQSGWEKGSGARPSANGCNLGGTTRYCTERDPRQSHGMLALLFVRLRVKYLSHAKGHHYLPQFLLGGFASRISRNQKYAFVFRKENEPAEPNIKDIAKQRYFHGDPDENDLEHLTSLRESEHAKLISKLRSDDISSADKPHIDERVIHLGLRTRNLRDGLTASGETFFDAFEDHVSGVAGSEEFDATVMKVLKEQIETPHYAMPS